MPTLIDPRTEAFAYQPVRSACQTVPQATEGGKMQDATVTGARKVAANKPANRPNKPETARFRPDFAASRRHACRAPRLPAQAGVARGDDA